MRLEEQIPQEWSVALQETLSSDATKQLFSRVEGAYSSQKVYPAQEQLFRALELTPLSQVRVVLLGQDPYFHPGEAEGLAFSVPKGMAIPSSLRNIHGALWEDLGISPPNHGSLVAWTKQGVLLLNTILTVGSEEEDTSHGKTKYSAISHAGLGWESLTDALLSVVDHKSHPVVFMLWGKAAQGKKALINTSRHCILETVHPSGLSAWRGFRQCRHFSQANAFLREQGLKPICWEL